MGFKEKLQKKIEENAVVSYLHGEKVILKKSKIPLIGGEWKQIHPPIDEKGNILWFNVITGGWRNFLSIVFILVIIGLFLFQYYEALNVIQQLKENCIGFMMQP